MTVVSFSRQLNTCQRCLFRAWAHLIGNQYPILWDTIKFGLLYTFAEIFQQLLTKKILDHSFHLRPALDISREPIEWLAVLRYAAWGFCLFPHILRFWYQYLDSIFESSGWKAAWKKTILDQVVFPLPILVAFFLFLSALEGNLESWDAFTAECRAKLLFTLKARYCIMFPAQLINFSCVSPANRVIYVGFVSFFWLSILSIVMGLDPNSPIFRT
ncbi:hypothetical protein TCAL_16055 [Tigriopus californicus]|uniref:Peroxisomal membrane protein 2 n=1 Tax=Tigriopus californicus TaxID=6832 RepID=A0A553PQB3_TIGCA|nr:hypothetical protein TCAL_16055 [Tigriopus californicus]